MRAAADQEDASEKHVAMENRLWPMRELLGELLLEIGEPAAALVEFEKSLQDSRNRLRGLHGAARAAERVGEAAKAKDYYARMVSLGARSDADRKELAQARAYLAIR